MTHIAYTISNFYDFSFSLPASWKSFSIITDKWNGNYVFALPARYNFAYPLGYKEVEQILQGKPLHPMQFYDIK